MVERVIQARDLKLSDLGKTVRSVTYQSKNLSAKPKRYMTRKGEVIAEVELQYEIESIYAHECGTILINQNHTKQYLRPDTQVTVIEHEE